MEGFMRGDVIVINFPFTDLSEVKRRPALVLKVVDNEDLILCQITSRFKQDKFSIPLSSDDFHSGSLPKESYIRPNRIFTLHKELILKKAGAIKIHRMANILHEIISFLQNE